MNAGLRLWLLAASAVVCAGCSTVGRLAPTADVKSADDAYYVFRVTPGKPSVKVASVLIEDGRVRENNGLTSPIFAPFLDEVEDGYVVGKAHHGGEALAIWEIITDEVYAPCPRAKAIVFTAPAGKVIYLLDLEVRSGEAVSGVKPPLEVRYSRPNFEAARAFLKTRYPRLAEKLEMGSYELMSCSNAPG